MNAVVTAGSRPAKAEPLYKLAQGGFKAMIAINGRPMIQWVLDALNRSWSINGIVVVGLPLYSDLACDKPLTLLEDQGGAVLNARAGLSEIRQWSPEDEYTLLLTGDIPAINGEMIDWVTTQADAVKADFIYPVVARKEMEKHYPGSGRTYFHLKDIDVCGGNLMIVRNQVASDDNPLWQRITDARKNPLRQAELFGYDTVFMVALRQLTLEEAGRSISKRLGIQAVPVLCPYPEIGMDIHKPAQIDLVQAEWARQAAG